LRASRQQTPRGVPEERHDPPDDEKGNRHHDHEQQRCHDGSCWAGEHNTRDQRLAEKALQK
jgi:hypothetical protein